MDASRTLVVDNGTGFVKVGYAGSNFPQHVFPSVVGRPILRAEEKVGNVEVKDIMVGDEAAEVRSILQMSYPMENGIIKKWEDMKHLWNYTFYEKLKVDPRECKVLLTEPPMNPLVNRREMVRTMFEEYGFQGVYVSIQAVLTLYAQGLLTGVVVDSGDGVTHIVPIYDGFALPHQTRRLDVAGRDVTRYLIKLLLLRGYAFNRTADFETVRQIKEKLCYVRYKLIVGKDYDLQLDQKLANETTVLVENYTLPDGRVIKVGSERFEAPECMFQPHLIDNEQDGVAEMLFEAIQDAALDVRSELYRHIVLSGGSSMYPGLPSRLEKELKQLYLERVANGDNSRLQKLKIRIEDPPRRKHMVFLGGAVLANIMKDRESWWITKQEWEEEGIRSLDKLGISGSTHEKLTNRGYKSMSKFNNFDKPKVFLFKIGTHQTCKLFEAPDCTPFILLPSITFDFVLSFHYYCFLKHFSSLKKNRLKMSATHTLITSPQSPIDLTQTTVHSNRIRRRRIGAITPASPSRISRLPRRRNAIAPTPIEIVVIDSDEDTDVMSTISSSRTQESLLNHCNTNTIIIGQATGQVVPDQSGGSSSSSSSTIRTNMFNEDIGNDIVALARVQSPIVLFNDHSSSSSSTNDFNRRRDNGSGSTSSSTNFLNSGFSGITSGVGPIRDRRFVSGILNALLSGHVLQRPHNSAFHPYNTSRVTFTANELLYDTPIFNPHDNQADVTADNLTDNPLYDFNFSGSTNNESSGNRSTNNFFNNSHITNNSHNNNSNNNSNNNHNRNSNTNSNTYNNDEIEIRSAPPVRRNTSTSNKPLSPGHATNLNESMILICAECDNLLGEGIWTFSCSHIICAVCAQHFLSGTKKWCPSCNSKVKKASMLQLYV
ncbi:hypothetical protein G9A89_004701 [Geosiphon pyriformis]|nr:hypothetical protein G9A89_004701 [Geosiphon pyriformis]